MSVWLARPLVGATVMLRPPAPGDEPALIEMATDPRVCRYLKGPAEPGAAAEHARRKVNSPGWGTFVIVSLTDGVVAGQGSLARKRGPWEVSYKLRFAYWGQGLAGDALAQIRSWYFDHIGETPLIVTTQSENERSRRLLQRAGATLTGTFQQYGLQQERYEFYASEAPR